MVTSCLYRFVAWSPWQLWCSLLPGWSPSPYWWSYIMFHPLGPWTAEVKRKSKTCWCRNYWENAGKWKHFGVKHYRKASQRNGIWVLMLSFPVPARPPSTETRFVLFGWRYYMILKKSWTIAQIAELLCGGFIPLNFFMGHWFWFQATFSRYLKFCSISVYMYSDYVCEKSIFLIHQNLFLGVWKLVLIHWPRILQ